jgi:hypothetical protein
MNSIYHCLGFFVFWGSVIIAAYFGGLVTWEAGWFFPVRRRIKHLIIAFKLIFTNERVLLGRNYCRTMIAIANGHKWAGWERDVLAALIKRARKNNFTPLS